MKAVNYPTFLKPLITILENIRNNKENKITDIIAITCRSSGKTTTALNSICALADKPILVNVVKKTFQKLTEIFKQIKSTILYLYDEDVKWNKSTRELRIKNMVFRGYTLNTSHLKGKEKVTGIGTENWMDVIINLFDEVAPDLDKDFVNQFIQSQKSPIEKKVEKINLFFANPWVESNYYIADWLKNTHWTREKALTEPYYQHTYKEYKCYIAASIRANPLCPIEDLKTLLHTAQNDTRMEDITILGLPGASSGQVFDNFTKMKWIDFGFVFDKYVGGIDIGWTDTGNKGGATTMEVFKWNYKYGMNGCLEYYHHNKDYPLSQTKQQTLMLEKLCEFLMQEHNNKDVYIKIDGGTGNHLGILFQDEWDKHFAHKVQNLVEFSVAVSGKLKWKKNDRYTWINHCLGYNFLQVNSSIQPHLYSDLESAVYEEKKYKVEANPDIAHEFTDTIMALTYAAMIGAGGRRWLDDWRNLNSTKTVQQINTNSTWEETTQPQLKIEEVLK